MFSLWEILIPVADNDGDIFPRGYTKKWEKKVLDMAGGYSALNPWNGAWKNGDKIYRERMTPYRIRCDEDTIAELANLAGKHFGQLAMMYYEISNDCRIMEVI